MIKDHLGIREKTVATYLELDNGDVMIGAPETAVHVMTKMTYNDIFQRVTNAKDLVLKLISELFEDEELARFNYHGGEVNCKSGIVFKDAIKHNVKFQAIVAQVNLEFPKSLQSASSRKALRDAVNGKCRKIASKLGL